MKVAVRAAVLASVCLALDTGAQVTFDVASIKENRDERSPTGLRRSPDGGLQALRFRARFLITIAYGLQPFQLLGAPAVGTL